LELEDVVEDGVVFDVEELGPEEVGFEGVADKLGAYFNLEAKAPGSCLWK